MESGARKIELQSPDDLSYLLANVRRAAASRLDEAFPPVDGAHGEDELRTRIEALVNEYITKTFTLAAPNLSINGLPVSESHILPGKSSSSHNPSEPEIIYEPFDARKRARVEELTREEEDLLRDIAALKKSVPAAAAASWSDAVKKGVKEDEEMLARRIAESAKEDMTKPENGLKVEGLERQADVEKSYGNAVQGLARLKREMGAVAARMERARSAGGYVVTEK